MNFHFLVQKLVSDNLIALPGIGLSFQAIVPLCREEKAWVILTLTSCWHAPTMNGLILAHPSTGHGTQHVGHLDSKESLGHLRRKSQLKNTFTFSYLLNICEGGLCTRLRTHELGASVCVPVDRQLRGVSSSLKTLMFWKSNSGNQQFITGAIYMKKRQDWGLQS